MKSSRSSAATDVIHFDLSALVKLIFEEARALPSPTG